jgi:hypothetical protein
MEIKFEHPDDKRAYDYCVAVGRQEGWLADGEAISADDWRRLEGELGPYTGQGWWTREALELLRRWARPRERAKVASEALKQRAVDIRGHAPMLLSLARIPGWEAAAEDGLRGVGARTVADTLRRQLFGTDGPPLPRDCSYRQVLDYLHRLAQRPRSQETAQVVVVVADYLAPVLAWRAARYVYAGQAIRVPPESALAETLETTFLLSALLQVWDKELLDHLLTGSPLRGLPWVSIGRDMAVVGGSLVDLEEMGFRVTRLWGHLFEEFERMRKERRARWGTGEALRLWQELFAARAGKSFNTEGALHQAIRRWRLRHRAGPGAQSHST